MNIERVHLALSGSYVIRVVSACMIDEAIDGIERDSGAARVVGVVRRLQPHAVGAQDAGHPRQVRGRQRRQLREDRLRRGVRPGPAVAQHVNPAEHQDLSK